MRDRNHWDKNTASEAIFIKLDIMVLNHNNLKNMREHDKSFVEILRDLFFCLNDAARVQLEIVTRALVQNK